MSEESFTRDFRNHIEKGLHMLNGKDSAVIQYLLYEGWIREVIRTGLPKDFRVSKGIIVDGHYEPGRGSPECDIIIYKGRSVIEAKRGTIAVISKESVRAVVEVEKTLRFSKGLADKLNRFKQFTRNVFVATYCLYRDSSQNVEEARQDLERKLRVRIYPITNGWGGLSEDQVITGEISRLIHDLHGSIQESPH